jgi:rhamnose utilization protein RhaD (predicted bifunctional aldolase and dehydrogenase)
VSRAATVLGPIAAPVDRWETGSAGDLTGLDELVYRSNLLGADRAIANQGGGNTSTKGRTLDHAGRETRVLWVKGSGTDLATITAAGFAALRLDEVLLLRSREAMDDPEMVDYLRRTALSPDGPRPSRASTTRTRTPSSH